MSFRETYVLDQDGQYSNTNTYVETFPQLTIFLQRHFSNKLSFTTEATTTTTPTSHISDGQAENTLIRRSLNPNPNIISTLTSTGISAMQDIIENHNNSYISSSEIIEDVDYDFDNVTGIPVPTLGAPFSNKFDATEYAVLFLFLSVSISISVFYGCLKGQKSTLEEFFRCQMSTIPAALSLLCSFITITILSSPAEIFMYGSQSGLTVLSFIPLTLSLAYLYIPVFHHLQLNSLYEYLELRFESRSVRLICSGLGCVHYVIYMAIVVYGPSIAIGQVTGINPRISTAVIFLVCIFYSTLGGLKAIIATDALQALIMIGSLSAIVWRGITDLGGLEVVWEIAGRHERTEFFNFDLDPRTRHTFWTAVIGGYLQWLPNFAATHSQVQRYLSMANLASIRRALLLNLIGLVMIFSLCYLAGLAVFAKYHNCDPIRLGSVSTKDQLLPLFVMDTMGDYPGLPGLFVAGITCASLSSVSNGLNSLSAILTYDYMKKWMPALSDTNLLNLSRCFCVLFGTISFGCIFVAEYMGDILPAAFAISGIVIGPTLGIFTLGMFCPWANSKGSLLGLLSAFFLMISLVVGNLLAEYEKLLPDQTLPGLTTNECEESDFSNISSLAVPTFSNMSMITGSPHHQAQIASSSFKDFDSEFLLDIFSITCMWYPGLGCVLAILFGLMFSLILTKCEKSKGVNPDHLSPPVVWLLMKFFPVHAAKWIDIDEDYPVLSSNSSATATLSLRSADFTFRKESVCEMKLKRLPFLKP